MVEVVPFKGLLYNESKAGSLAELIAPPYDVIRPNMQEELYSKNPYNVVRLILGKQFPDDSEDNNRYTRSAKDFLEWKNKGILKEDSSPCFYVYSQEFTFNEKTNHRIGFFGRVKLEDFSQGNICPHEFTLSKAKKDRAQLIRACRANFSPVFGLYSDPEGVIDKQLHEVIKNPPLATIQENTITNRIWRIEDNELIAFVSKQFDDKKVYIADGHHRYETSLGYFKEHGHEVPDAAHVMMFLTNLDAQSLTIYPIHRQVKCPKPFDREKFLQQLEPFFEIEISKPNLSAEKWIETLEKNGQQQISFGIYFGKGEGIFIKLKDTKNIIPFLDKDDPDELQVLDVCQLHSLVLKHLLEIDTKNPDHQQYISYNVRTEETMENLDAEKFDLAFFMNATQINQVRSLAEKGIRLPQKATYFYPKLLSGLVINPFRL